MPNFGTVIKEEVRRLARKEIRAAVGPVQKRLAETRRTAADLKRRVASLEGVVKQLKEEADARRLQAARAGAEEPQAARVGARSIRSQRKRLKLTREEFASLLGVSANTVYLWETDKVAPRGKSRSALVGIREVGAREARQLVEAAGRKAAARTGARGRAR